MSDSVLVTRPLNSEEKALRAHFANHVAGQSDLMDKLAGQLITVELAVVGVYAAAIKLLYGEKATAVADNWLILTSAAWTLALALTLASFVPRKWKVDPTLLDEDVAGQGQLSGAISIRSYFYRSARHKRRLLLTAIVFFWLGAIAAVLTAVRW